MTRPYVLGLNNPQGHTAFHTLPVGCAGYRMWRMVHDVSGICETDWLRGTQRNNLLADAVLPRDYRSAARRRGEFLAPLLQGRTVVLVGNDVAAAMGHAYPPFVWDPDRDWVQIPHPSGRNPFYNDPANRLAAGILLSEILAGCPAPVKEEVT